MGCGSIFLVCICIHQNGTWGPSSNACFSCTVIEESTSVHMGASDAEFNSGFKLSEGGLASWPLPTGLLTDKPHEARGVRVLVLQAAVTQALCVSLRSAPRAGAASCDVGRPAVLV